MRARTGCVASRLARMAAMLEAMIAGVAGRRVEAGAHHDGAGRQRGVAVGEVQRRGGQAGEPGGA